jgi:hypothetical protein
MKRLIRIGMCLLLVGFGVERAIDGKRLLAAETKTKSHGKTQETFAKNESFELSDAEEGQVATDEDSDSDVEADDSADDDSMQDSWDDEGEDVGGDSDDNGGARMIRAMMTVETMAEVMADRRL